MLLIRMNNETRVLEHFNEFAHGIISFAKLRALPASKGARFAHMVKL